MDRVPKLRYVVVPLSMAPFPSSFLDAINGYATGGSTRCLDAIHEEGAWLLSKAPYSDRLSGNVSPRSVGISEGNEPNPIPLREASEGQ